MMLNQVPERPWHSLRRRLMERRHTALLVAIILLFLVRPSIGDAGAGPMVFSTALVLLLVVALYTIQVDELAGERDALLAQRRRRTILGWALAVPAVIERLAIFVIPNAELYITGTIVWLLFIAYVTWSQLRSVLKQREVTSETISMSISVYLLLGLTWGLFYIVLSQLQTNAFSLGTTIQGPAARADKLELFPVLVYFSLTTLSTIGFGDITPLTLQARYAAVAEGITGQFYLAILVARLVGLQMSQSAKGSN